MNKKIGLNYDILCVNRDLLSRSGNVNFIEKAVACLFWTKSGLLLQAVDLSVWPGAFELFFNFFWIKYFIEYFWLFWMNDLLNEYFGFYFELNIELNHFLARFNEKMNIQNVSARATLLSPHPIIISLPRTRGSMKNARSTWKHFEEAKIWKPWQKSKWVYERDS